MTEADFPTRNQEAYDYAKGIWEHTIQQGQFTPPSESNTFIFPGLDGGGEWGGAAVDPKGILYVNNSDLPWLVKMLPHEVRKDKLLASKESRSTGRHV